MRIGIFDSGIGGLTVLKKLLDAHPHNEYIYYGDTIHLPYGEKTKEQLLEYSSKIVPFLVEKNVDIILLACGTISSNITQEIKRMVSIPVLDIISPTIELVTKKYNNIAVLATPMTIQSNVFEEQLKNQKVISIPCPKLVPLIEANQEYSGVCEQAIKEYTAGLKEQNIEAIILGCTHYPIIKNQIEEISEIPTIDMAEALLPYIDNGEIGSLQLYFSKVDDNLERHVTKILERLIPINLKQL